jgi:nucleotidyltransferase/DNA polymerase involved in DNA repair
MYINSSHPLPVARLSGVGKVTGKRLEEIGVRTVGELRVLDTAVLEGQFGRYGARLYELARGIDHARSFPTGPQNPYLSKTRLSMTCFWQKRSPLYVGLRKEFGLRR